MIDKIESSTPLFLLEAYKHLQIVYIHTAIPTIFQKFLRVSISSVGNGKIKLPDRVAVFQERVYRIHKYNRGTHFKNYSRAYLGRRESGEVRDINANINIRNIPNILPTDITMHQPYISLDLMRSSQPRRSWLSWHYRVAWSWLGLVKLNSNHTYF